MTLLQALADATMTRDEAEGRVYGWLIGVVTDAEAVDGKKTCRVKARVGKQGDNESTDWLVPMFPGGIESVPHVNDKIGVTFMDGDVHRGAYFYYPDTRTQNRPNDWMILGSVFAGMYNDLATKFNTLRSQYNALQSDLAGLVTAFNGQVYANGGHPTAYVSTSGQDNDSNVGKIQNADGSIVTATTGDQKALSGRARVGI